MNRRGPGHKRQVVIPGAGNARVQLVHVGLVVGVFDQGRGAPRQRGESQFRGFRGQLSGREPAEEMKYILSFLNDEQGQDLIEYTLLMAFVALASAALFLGGSGSVKGIWSVTNNQTRPS